ncbi:VRR-NUC domain-containing protein [Pseudohoeflea suaedae]|uniref:VRR-NUC domain-containing protein n=2 Tax=Pseudohoeflea suaedae TaxID=877384 RepID=A0A4V3A756_9HYPH|nr:VRR-NUC domain-containing protein [Pseudohoeflea suaedae]
MTTQTTRIDGRRVKITTRNGKTMIAPADPLEWELQAAQVRRLKAMPEYGKRFLIAGDMNAGKRKATAQAQAVATGMAPGEPDLRVYLPQGRIGLIENKVGSAPLTASQKERHPSLAKLGHPVTVIRAKTEEDAADQAEAAVREWLSAS